MSNAILFVLLFFLATPAWGVRTLIEFKENGDTLYYQVPEEQQGSGFSLSPRLWLGPSDGTVIDKPDPPSPHARPPINNGTAGVPVDIPPDDPGGSDPTLTWDCNIIFVNQTASEKAKYNAACSMIETIVVSDAFEQSVLTKRSYNGSVGYYGSSSTCNSAGELGNVGASVYAHILAGNETRPTSSPVDHQMDLKIEMYRDNTSTTIGYTYADADQIWVNRKYSDGYKPSSMASNAFHEWLHKCGYGHSSASTACRPYSIPYAIGYMIRDYATPLNAQYGY